MAKFAFLLATFAVLILVTSASFHATVEIEEENPARRGERDCHEQFQRQQQLRSCQEYMRQECGGRRRGGSRDELDVNQGRQHLQQCCEQLEDMETKCRCEGLEQAVMQQQRQQGRRMEREEMYDCASNIPSMCRMEPSECQFGRRIEV